MKTITNDVVTTALNIIDALIDSGLMETKNIYKFLYEDLSPSLGITKVANGATKWVVMPEHLEGWVIKFSNSPYCKREADNFKLAVEDGFANYFPATYLLREEGEWSFIISEKCYGNQDDAVESAVDTLMDSGCWDERADAYEYIDDGNISDEEMVDIFIGDHSFTNWLYNHDINDLHSGNFLQNEEGYWVIIDFSGYDINFDEEEDEYDD